MDTIDTLKRAISIISKEMAKNPALAQVDTRNFRALVQSLSTVVDAAAFSSAGKQKLIALVQASQGSGSEEDPSGAPSATVYKSHSSDLLDLLEDLQEKAEEDLSALRKAETDAKQNYAMLKQSLDDANKNGDKDLADEKAVRKAAQEEKATNEKDLQMTAKALSDAKAMLSDVQASCMEIASDHEASVASRNEELKVLAEAKKVLTETSTGAVEQTYSFLQVSENSRMRTRADLKRAEVLSKVKTLARHFHSSALAQLASRIEAAVKLGTQAGADPFAKVKDLIEDPTTGLIVKLEKEASDAADEKAYCDDQMAKTEEKKSELEEDLDTLTAKMDKAAATSATLKDDVATLQKELAELAKMQAELDKIRADTSAAFKVAKEELSLGLTGVGQALTILRSYYSSEAAALVQTGQPEPPVMHSAASGAGGSIIGILEVCQSDFAKNLAKREHEEADEAAEYERLTQENAVIKTEKSQALKYKTQEFKSLDKALADMTSDKETMNTELKAVLEYYSKIKDRCIAKPEAYEERKRRREAEIAGLKDALSILESETALVQLRSGRHVRRTACSNTERPPERRRAAPPRALVGLAGRRPRRLRGLSLFSLSVAGCGSNEDRESRALCVRASVQMCSEEFKSRALVQIGISSLSATKPADKWPDLGRLTLPARTMRHQCSSSQHGHFVVLGATCVAGVGRGAHPARTTDTSLSPRRREHVSPEK
ncbi:unnamed protein product [Prorocentrum cordatum]|uniref:Uncharacterized protein n=1 Tax=Prorocentrum cordatum TaxID=2364126 RepID=A0ABN9Y0W7_9DINO|nr:unnamed protein product [Polarella glacialis]